VTAGVWHNAALVAVCVVLVRHFPLLPSPLHTSAVAIGAVVQAVDPVRNDGALDAGSRQTACVYMQTASLTLRRTRPLRCACAIGPGVQCAARRCCSRPEPVQDCEQGIMGDLPGRRVR